MIVTVNGASLELPDGGSVADLVEQQYGVQRGIAVAVGGEVVPHSTWVAHVLRPGDRVEVLTAVQGG